MAVINIIISVDWEGRDLAPENLQAFSSFREQFPQIPLLQFFNPVYFLHPSLKEKLPHYLALTMRPQDEIGFGRGGGPQCNP